MKPTLRYCPQRNRMGLVYRERNEQGRLVERFEIPQVRREMLAYHPWDKQRRKL